MSRGYVNTQVFPIFSGPFSSVITTHTILPALHSISFQSSFPSFSSYSHLPFIHINSISGFTFPFGFPLLTSFHHIKLLSPFTLFCTSTSRGISAELKTMTSELSGGSLEDLIYLFFKAPDHEKKNTVIMEGALEVT